MDWKQVKYDAIVIGSGASGATAAKCLTDGGAKVLLLEAGPALPATKCWPTEKSLEEFNTHKSRQPVQSKSLLYNRGNCHLYTDDMDNPYTTTNGTSFNWIRSRQAGGRTLVWSRFALRMSERDFSSNQHEAAENSWPISYDDLAPYYDKVETLVCVSGTIERNKEVPDNRLLLRQGHNFLSELDQKLQSRIDDCQLLPARRAADRPVDRATHPPSFSTIGSILLHAHDRLTFRSDCVVARIELDRPNHAKSVIFVDRLTQRSYEVTGRVVLLCASTIESTRILLASSNHYFPTGLGNTSGTLGHYLMDHFGGPRLVALGKIADAKPMSHEHCYIPRFCNIKERTEDFSGGYSIQADFETQKNGLTILTMGVFGEVLPYFDNRIELDPSVRDSCGLAVPKITFRYRENEQKMGSHSREMMREIVSALGFQALINQEDFLVPGTRAHELGGIRMGKSHHSSVLNCFNQCWDVANLFVTDGSCFPRVGDKGPTLTMMALTARACDYILKRLKSGTL